MKPCRKNRKPIVWLILGNLDASQSAELAQHLQLCPGCRHYHEQMLLLTRNLRSVSKRVEESPCDALVQAGGPVGTRRFQRAPAERRQAHLRARPIPAEPFLSVAAALLRWRVAFPAALAITITLLIVSGVGHRPVSQPVPPMAPQAPGVLAELRPTLGNYHAAAMESLEELDQVLTTQARQIPPPPPSLNAASLAMVHLAD